MTTEYCTFTGDSLQFEVLNENFTFKKLLFELKLHLKVLHLANQVPLKAKPVANVSFIEF